MIGKTNIGGGSSLSFKGALICIIAPIGSTITLMKNNLIVKILYPKNQHIFNNDKAYWYYSVTPSNYGEWTVTASQSGNTASKTVTVSTNKQYDVFILFGELYKNGSQYTELTGGWSATIGSEYVTFDTHEIFLRVFSPTEAAATVCTENKIDLSRWSLLKANFWCDYNAYARREIGVASTRITNQDSSDRLAYMNHDDRKTGDHTLTVDISSQEGAFYVYMSAWRENMHLYHVWLEK